MHDEVKFGQYFFSRRFSDIRGSVGNFYSSATPSIEKLRKNSWKYGKIETI